MIEYRCETDGWNTRDTEAAFDHAMTTRHRMTLWARDRRDPSKLGRCLYDVTPVAGHHPDFNRRRV